MALDSFSIFCLLCKFKILERWMPHGCGISAMSFAFLHQIYNDLDTSRLALEGSAFKASCSFDRQPNFRQLILRR